VADRVTVADVALAADDELAAAFADPPWRVQMGGPPDVAAGGAVWCEVIGSTTATGTAGSRGEAVTLRMVAAVRSRTAGPERADQIDAMDRFIGLAAGWSVCTRHVLTVESIEIGGVDTPAVLAALTVLAPPC